MTTTSAWRCTVCGYVHRGSEPPDVCPVCGAGKEVFEVYVEETKPQPAPTVAWKCLNCTYVHPGTKAPETCPVCGAQSDRFKPAEGIAQESAGRDEALDVVIIGAGIAGVSAAEALRAAAPAAKITLLSKETELPYYRLNLTRYLAGEIEAEQLPLHPLEWYQERGIELRLGEAALDLDPEERVVNLRGDSTLAFDRLVLTAGSHSFVPPIPGGHREGVVALRTIRDADLILENAAKGIHTVVLGGGLLGLETAGALAKRGYRVTVAEGFDWLLPRQLNRRAGEILASFVEGKGIGLRTSVKVKEIVGDECVRGLMLDDSTVIAGEQIVVATGVRPNSYLARQAGLEVNLGVVVDNKLQTSHAHVFAAGDIAEHQGVLYGTWGPAQYQGSIAGMNAAGATTEFGGIPRSNTLKVLGIDLFSIGVVAPDDASFTEIELDEDDGKYARFLFRDSSLVGAILLGDTRLTATVTKLVEARRELSELLERRPDGKAVVEALSSSW